MTPLQKIESELLSQIDGLTLRPTLQRVCRIGELLSNAKEIVEQGQWLRWVKRVGLSVRTSQLYMQAFAYADDAKYISPTKRITLVEFIAAIRKAKRAARRQQLLDYRQDALAAPETPADKRYQIVHQDCRKFKWPDAIDVVATGPPWQDLDAYRWLANFSYARLKSGGMVMVQTGVYDLPTIFDIFRGAGLRYEWTLNIVFAELRKQDIVRHPWLGCSRPVVIFSKGELDRRGIQVCSDVYTAEANAKMYHDWQQPRFPWLYWLSRLTLPNSLIVDPFAGAATIGVCCKEIGQRQYIGTEVDPKHAKIARHRLAQTKEGSFIDARTQ